MSELIAEPAVTEPVAPVDTVPVEPVEPAEGDTGSVEEGASTASVPAAPAFDADDVIARLEFAESRNAELLSALAELANSQPPASPFAGPQTGTQQQDPVAAIAAQVTDEFGQVNVPALLQVLGAQQQATVQTISQQLAPLVEALQRQQEDAREAAGREHLLNNVLAADVAANGEFASTPEADALARDRVYNRAEEIFQDLVPTHGNNRRTSELAMRRAAAEVREYNNLIRGEGASEHQNRMATLAGAAGDVGAGSAAGVNGTPEFKSPGDVLRYWGPKLRES